MISNNTHKLLFLILVNFVVGLMTRDRGTIIQDKLFHLNSQTQAKAKSYSTSFFREDYKIQKTL